MCEHPRYGAQVTARELDKPAEVDWDQLVDGPATPIAKLERQLDELLETLRDRHLAALMNALAGSDAVRGRAFRRAFAAQHNHHAHRGGLLEHSLAVAHAGHAATAICDRIHRGLAVCGALLHDIGKLDAYSGDEHTVTLNDTGRLVGEIPSGYYIVRRQIERIPSFPPDRAKPSFAALKAQKPQDQSRVAHTFAPPFRSPATLR